jgi:glycosyltransferase involved in cell wall biosynthesis
VTLVLLDADVLGRRRTGDETYVQNLLRALPEPAAAAGLELAAATRHPELVPPGVEPLDLPAGSQEIRMAWSMPRLLRRVRPALAHFQHALPLRPYGRTVLTVHDLSFEHSREAMPLKDTLAFRVTVPRSARRAARVIAVSERTKRDVVELYRVPPERVAVIPHGVDPAFGPARDGPRAGYLLFVGAIMRRKDPLAAAAAAAEVGLPLVVVGPEKEPRLAAELRRRGADLRGYVEKAELADLYRGAEALLLPSRYEGFGFPVLEAMACGTPVVVSDSSSLPEVVGDAGLIVPADSPEAWRQALEAVAGDASLAADLRRRGILRAAQFSWERSADLTWSAVDQVVREAAA